MALLKRLAVRRSGHIGIQLVQYFLVGGSAAVVDLSVFLALVFGMDVDYRLAVFVALTCGATVNFILSNHFVFHRNGIGLWHAMGRHYLASVGGLGVNEGVMILLVEVVGWSNMFGAKLVAMGVAFFVNFLSIKLFAFRDGRGDSGGMSYFS